MATKFLGKIGKEGLLHLNLLCKYSVTHWKIIMLMGYTAVI